MTDNDLRRIGDVLNLAKEVSNFLPVDFEIFSKNLILIRAVERSVELIGESAGKISLETREVISDVEWRKVMDLRIILAHNYQRVNLPTLWQAATVDVPELARILQTHVDHPQ